MYRWNWKAALAALCSAPLAFAQPMPPPCGPVAGPSVNVKGVVTRLLINPEGDLDGVLLDNNDVLRFPPRPPDAVPRVTVGASLKATGEGTPQHLRVDSLTVGTGTPVLMPGPPPPRRGGPSALAPLEDSSQVTRVLPGPRGETEVFLLADGAVVRVPPGLQGQIQGVAPGVRIQVRGDGGRYPLGLAIHARSLQIGTGPWLSEVDGPVPPPPSP